LLDFACYFCKDKQKIRKTQNNAADLSINAFVLINIVFVLTDIDVVFTLGRHSAPFCTALQNLLHGIFRLLPSTCFAANQKERKRNSVLPSIDAVYSLAYKPFL